MILSDRSIKKAIDMGSLKITPLVTENIQPASVDLTLMDEFYLFNKTGLFDPKRPGAHTEPLLAEDSLLMDPGDFILGSTLEAIELPAWIAAQVGGKSSLARIGIAIHVTAGFIDPGFCGRITLEIKNMGMLPVRLYPGMKIAQIVFEQLTTPCDRPYGSEGLGSHYQNQDCVTPSKIHENWRL